MAFGDLLRRLREDVGMTQADLAEKSGVALRTIQGWEQNYRCPVSADFFRMTRALGIAADVFADAVKEDEPTSAKRPRGRPSASAQGESRDRGQKGKRK